MCRKVYQFRSQETSVLVSITSTTYNYIRYLWEWVGHSFPLVQEFGLIHKVPLGGKWSVSTQISKGSRNAQHSPLHQSLYILSKICTDGKADILFKNSETQLILSSGYKANSYLQRSESQGKIKILEFFSLILKKKTKNFFSSCIAQCLKTVNPQKFLESSNIKRGII